MNDLLSVIVPAYNVEEYIARCIESILKQTYENIELIIINDGSTDKTLNIIRSYEKKDSRIHVINKKNGGVVSARKAGIECCKGKWIGFVDADDFIDKNMYFDMLSKIINTDSEMCVIEKCSVRESIFANTSVISARQALEALCQMRFPSSLCAGVFPADVVKTLFVPDDIHFFEDFFLMYLVLHQVKHISLSHNDFYHYENNACSVTHQGISFKRMSCLKIISYITYGGKYYDKQLKDYLPFAVAHFLVCNILFTGSNKVEEKMFRRILKNECKMQYKFVKGAKCVPFLYKVLIGLYRVVPNFTSMLMYVRRKMK